MSSVLKVYDENTSTWVDIPSIQGEKGDTGTAAGFGTPTATVGTGTGTPTVSVTASGADTAKVFSFAFDGLKGANGANGTDGVGVPSGGTQGQVLTKSSATDYDTAWGDGIDKVVFTFQVVYVGTDYSVYLSSYTEINDAILANKVVRAIHQDEIYNYSGSFTVTNSSYKKHRFERDIIDRTNKVVMKDMFYIHTTDGTDTTLTFDEAATGGVPYGGTVGQVLKKSSSVNYATEWGDLPSGDGDLKVSVTRANGSYTSDTTIEDILQAISDGKQVYVDYLDSSFPNTKYIYTLYTYTNTSSTKQAYFNYSRISSGSTAYEYYIRIYKSGNSTLCSGGNSQLIKPDYKLYYVQLMYDDTNQRYCIENCNPDYLGYITNLDSIYLEVYTEGNALPETGTAADSYDYYTIEKSWLTEAYNEDWGEYSTVSHITFSAIKNDNGTIKYKQFLLEGFSWNYYTDCTVTYSESLLGQAPSAQGVSF